MLNASYLIWIDKVWSDKMNLKSTTYSFLDEFFYCIEKNNGLKCFRSIIQRLFELWNNNWHWLLEMRRPISKINVWIHYIDNINNVFSIAYQYFEMAPENIVWTWSRWTTTFVDNINKSSFGERRPLCILV